MENDKRMKFNRKSKKLRRKELEQWHNWFAWYPVRINDTTLVWMERIQRTKHYDWIGEDGWSTTFYREITKETKCKLNS